MNRNKIVQIIPNTNPNYVVVIMDDLGKRFNLPVACWALTGIGQVRALVTSEFLIMDGLLHFADETPGFSCLDCLDPNVDRMVMF